MGRDQLQYDVVIVGAGPAGLSAACRIKQIALQRDTDISVCVVEKGAEVGAHSLSGALLQPTALNELFPDWQAMGAPLNVPVCRDEIYYLTSDKRGFRFPGLLAQRVIDNHGNYVISLSVFVRWLAAQAEQLGVEIYPGFAASEALFDDHGRVTGIVTGDMGVNKSGEAKPGFQPGIEILAKYTLFAEGCRGHVGKQLIQRYGLDRNSGTQHYALGIKELWRVDPEKHHPGTVMHSFGWPLSQTNTGGGAFLYHFENNQISLGLITDLNYENPYLSPFDELQRWKLHPKIRWLLEGGERLSYGARAINKGGYQALPKLSFPGGLIIGCDAGFMNYPKIKGNHTAMKSGMVAAETVMDELLSDQRGGLCFDQFDDNIRKSWVFRELKQARNVAPAMHRFGMLLGSVFSFIDYGILRGRLPITLQDPKPDHECLLHVDKVAPIAYPKPDGKITFDKLTSVYLSNVNHAEDQPCHLRLQDAELPINVNLPEFAEPAQRYCPAGVYEIAVEAGEPIFKINSQNCVHCKTCDIKDPYQNITWIAPEAGGGPNYGSM
ncbi:electron transfer flavoprotein-ubiquinone oxidoreductase [Ketobacter sp. MCCC 1A13808]|uniref:electron transfer flavoprotein-ubiquinone oxidoreductase n=1 Tax=Ketobacter sp. MCCC 1A13808 TaxID=2602738 RepID=UPI000F1CAF44|nr:electron transfer flavoprotein-ubiquinone oxidoreductase [Ketobacter sp. MCCC 1A13808]MVF14646.1 electron transfer flavoprotein-ubiquinone oxidoreductase [Ketobacter sp. MCCC 1A13808]RLP52425.1 MAG: electron transfer flavoprotein-ubiquinone oxidoreductase [Ketobacter sp.]